MSEVSRYDPTDGEHSFGDMMQRQKGGWVRYSDYEKLQERVGQTESAYMSLCHELARLLGPVKPRMDTTTNDQLIVKVGEVLAEHDQARKQVLDEVRERLKANANEIASCNHPFGAKQLVDEILATLHANQSKGGPGA